MNKYMKRARKLMDKADQVKDLDKKLDLLIQARDLILLSAKEMLRRINNEKE